MISDQGSGIRDGVTIPSLRARGTGAKASVSFLCKYTEKKVEIGKSLW